MSTTVTPALVKELREKTGVGFMECQKALNESKGDLDAAIKVLRERGIAKAEKRAGRATAEGLISLKLAPDYKKAVMVELDCETDFVSRNELFQGFLKEITDFVDGLCSRGVPAAGPGGEIAGEAIMDKPYPATPGHSLRDAIVERIAKTGENMTFRRFARYETTDGFIAGYIHPPGKIGVMVELVVSGGSPDPKVLETLVKDIAMHIAASAPRYIRRDDVDGSHLESEKEIYANKARNEGKPDKIIPNIVKGMVDKFYKDVCLLEQPFVKDPNVNVGQMIEAEAKKLGVAIVAKQFVRFQVG